MVRAAPPEPASHQPHTHPGSPAGAPRPDSVPPASPRPFASCGQTCHRQPHTRNTAHAGGLGPANLTLASSRTKPHGPASPSSPFSCLLSACHRRRFLASAECRAWISTTTRRSAPHPLIHLTAPPPCRARPPRRPQNDSLSPRGWINWPILANNCSVRRRRTLSLSCRAGDRHQRLRRLDHHVQRLQAEAHLVPVPGHEDREKRGRSREGRQNG